MRAVRAVAALSVAVSVLGAAAATSQPASARADTAKPARVTKLHASALSATGMYLSWRRSATKGFGRTLIRLSTGSHAPATPTSGTPVTTPTTPRQVITVKHLKPSTYYRFALFATDGHGHYARRAVVAAPTRSAPASNLRSYDDNTATTLAWTNPTSPFAAVVVRYARGGTAPAHPWTGHRVKVAAKATTATLPRLAKDTVYTAEVWTRDRFGHYSVPAFTRFTTDADPAADGTYTGTITDTAGHPLKNAVIQATDLDSFVVTLATRSASDGRFALHLPAGTYEIDMSGASATGGNSDASGYVGDGDLITVRAGRTTSSRTHVLEPGATLTGRVTDGSGQPLQGIVANLHGVSPYVPVDNSMIAILFSDDESGATTGADGRFTLRGVGRYAQLVCFDTGAAVSADGAGYAATCTTRAVAPLPRSTTAVDPVELAPTPGATITGRITTKGDKAVPYAGVILTATDGSANGDYVTAGSDGRFHVDGLPDGRYQLCARTDFSTAVGTRTGVAPGCAASTITARAGHPATGNVTLAAGAAVTGKLVAANGRPIADADVAISTKPSSSNDDEGEVLATTRTDATGHYTASSLPHGRYRACFDAEDTVISGEPTGVLAGCYGKGILFVLRQGSVRSGIDARLRVAGAISGVVKTAAGKLPDYLDVEATADDGAVDPLSGSASVDATGHYTVRGLFEGKYRVCFDAFNVDGAAPSTCAPGRATVVQGRTARFDATLPATGSIAVTVHDGDGHPIAGVDATALVACKDADSCDTKPLFSATQDASTVASFVTDQDGTVELNGLRPGHYAVCYYAYYGATSSDTPATGFQDACSGDTFDVLVTAGHSTQVSQTLAPAGAITGTVTDSGGHPLAGALVNVTQSAAGDTQSDDFPFVPSDGPAADDLTDANGRFTVRSIRPGSQRVCFSAERASGTSPGGYLDQCHGGAAGSTSGGTPVTVTRSATTSGVDISLTSGGAIAGHLRGKSGKAADDGAAALFDAKGNEVAYAQAYGTSYRITRIPAGTYVLCFDSWHAGGQCYKNIAWDPNTQAPPVKQATKIVVTAGQLITGLDATLPQG